MRQIYPQATHSLFLLLLLFLLIFIFLLLYFRREEEEAAAAVAAADEDACRDYIGGRRELDRDEVGRSEGEDARGVRRDI